MEMMSLDMEFGFNDKNFSDRILRIAILPADDHPHHTHQLHSSKGKITSWRRIIKSVSRLSLCSKFTGDEASQEKEAVFDDQLETDQGKSISVNSLILAAHSPFFHKLFSNGMKESRHQRATIHIEASEETAFMDLLKFMYSGKLSCATPPELLEVLRVADKFSVASCVKLCSQLLSSLPMTLELALVYLEIDSTSSMVDNLKQLSDTAKKFLLEHFKDIQETKLQEEFLMLPLPGVEVVLASDYLQIKSEDDIYNFIQKWVEKHHTDQLDEKRKTLNTLVRRFVRFPFISMTKLKEILTCEDIDPDVASELALESLAYHLAQPPDQRTRDKFVKRSYENLSLKVVSFDNSSSHPECVVYLDLKRDFVQKMIPGGRKYHSQNFFLGEHEIFLRVSCEQNSTFGLCLTSKMTGFSCQIAYMKKPSEHFVSNPSWEITIPEDSKYEYLGRAFPIPWATFIGEDSPHFINDTLHLRCHLKIKN